MDWKRNKQVCVVIPIYKSRLNKYERLSIDLVKEKLSCCDIFFMAHKELDMEEYRQDKEIKAVYFPKRYFNNSMAYSRLLLKEEFYKRFSDYKYMLIVQTDALVLGNAQQLDMFFRQGYDYWGARWRRPVKIHSVEVRRDLWIFSAFPDIFWKYICRHPRYCFVGNGGLSLRNIKKTIALLREKKIYAAVWFDNEDKFFAYHGLKNHVNFKVAPEDMADSFSLEDFIKQRLNEAQPFGVHAWRRWAELQTIRYLKEHGYLSR